MRKRTAGLALALAAFTAAGAASSRGVETGAAPLTREPGDPGRGRTVVADRSLSSCVFCHEVPGLEGPAGNMGPTLAGVGSKLSAAELRMRLIDSSRLNPESIMPPYYRTEGLNRVAPAYRGRPILSAQQIEDVVAYLATLK